MCVVLTASGNRIAVIKDSLSIWQVLWLESTTTVFLSTRRGTCEQIYNTTWFDSFLTTGDGPWVTNGWWPMKNNNASGRERKKMSNRNWLAQNISFTFVLNWTRFFFLCVKSKETKNKTSTSSRMSSGNPRIIQGNTRRRKRGRRCSQRQQQQQQYERLVVGGWNHIHHSPAGL